MKAKVCSILCTKETQVLNPPNSAFESKNWPSFAHYLPLKGHSIQRRSPSENHHIPDGTTGWDSALFSDDYPVSSDMCRYDNRNVTLGFSFMLPLAFKNSAHRPSFSSSSIIILPSKNSPLGLSCFCQSSFLTHPSNTSFTAVTPRGSKGLQQQWHEDDWKHGTDRWEAFWERVQGTATADGVRRTYHSEFSATL